MWPLSNAGYSSTLKTFWFGANASLGGLDSEETLALMAKHSVAGYGWQTGLGQVADPLADIKLPPSITSPDGVLTLTGTRGCCAHPVTTPSGLHQHPPAIVAALQRVSIIC